MTKGKTAIKNELKRAKECVYCGKPAEHKDHIIPRARGGPGKKDNILPICRKCNYRKGARPPIVFIQEVLQANNLPFRWNTNLPLRWDDKEQAQPEEAKESKYDKYLIKEYNKDEISFKIYREGDYYWFNLFGKDRNRRTALLLAGRLIALKVLGYSIDEFTNDNLLHLFERLAIMSWVFRDFDAEELFMLENKNLAIEKHHLKKDEG